VPGGRSVPGLGLVRLPVRPSWLLLIGAGGSLGTALRAALETAFAPAPGQWPWVTFWINVSGSFVLGALLPALTQTGEDQGWRRAARLGVGTGVLGGFTTYSTFSVEAVQLARAGAWPVGAGYALGSVVASVLAATAAMWGVRRLLRRWHSNPRPGGAA